MTTLTQTTISEELADAIDRAIRQGLSAGNWHLDGYTCAAAGRARKAVDTEDWTAVAEALHSLGRCVAAVAIKDEYTIGDEYYDLMALSDWAHRLARKVTEEIG